ncbi:ErmE/ErmH/ErmO/ErmR family 23S rRNA (adenine(2058)-N(6))-methyltransferase [Nocardiopsis potens]|uniref:ErmE/ErmH/ErmO/ErmR family 23S rRNA (adenine(2058)-N(6))-methyltransferase n=1 Tax=Nocardiopsis potens TaxID=1246458 RepID=UPI00034D77A6|nr:ErmE/ErmH/ErmO/ErmR family 23S rRNA (adenine(2058)-N(6))-methyltransferase [Nocardiopsis potens]
MVHTHRPHGHRSSTSGARGRRRALSQNHLTDASVARRLVRLADPGPGGLVFEVGAGDGMITRHLARTPAHVVAYELDPAFASRLAERYADRPRVDVRGADFLRAKPPREPFSVVGNIPYSRTADIVEWCLRARSMSSAALLTQLEYARKRTGAAGRWSKLTVTTWPQLEWRFAGRVQRNRFHPVPRVDGGILHLLRRDRPLIPGSALGEYRKLVAEGFTGTGGSLRASLRRSHPGHRVDAALRAAGVPFGAVVAFVSPDQWATLACHLLGIEREDGGRASDGTR